jgi:ACS family hexuronate transporter-like MFS transporter
MTLIKSRWLVLGVLFAGYVLNYLDRSALSVSAPIIATELKLRPSELGSIFGIFYFGYVGACFLGGYAADRFGARRIITGSMVAWSVFCALTAAASGFVSLLGIRFFFGAAEGPFVPASNKLISQRFPPSEYGGAASLAAVGMPIGASIAGPFVVALILAFGWRLAFLVIGAIGIAWAVIWKIIIAKKPDSVSPTPPSSNASEVRATTAPSALAPMFLQLVRRPAILAVTLANFGCAYTLFFFLSWYPSYLVSARHLNMTAMSIVGSIPWLCGIVGLIIGGFVSNYLLRWPWGALLGRKVMLVSGLTVTAASVALAGLVPSVSAAVTLMAVAVFSLYFTEVTYLGFLQDIVLEEHRGSAAGFVLIGAGTAGLIAPTLSGGIVEITGRFAGAFVVAGALALLGALAVTFFVPTRREDALA